MRLARCANVCHGVTYDCKYFPESCLIYYPYDSTLQVPHRVSMLVQYWRKPQKSYLTAVMRLATRARTLGSILEPIHIVQVTFVRRPLSSSVHVCTFQTALSPFVTHVSPILHSDSNLDLASINGRRKQNKTAYRAAISYLQTVPALLWRNSWCIFISMYACYIHITMCYINTNTICTTLVFYPKAMYRSLSPVGSFLQQDTFN